jgi:hypothetical protein
MKKCPSCGVRTAKRQCPALAASICPTCCGTKRQKEIECPPGCPYLSSAREHPAAAIRKERERDVAVLLPFIQDLTERQQQLFFLLHSAILTHQPAVPVALADIDVAEAAGATAATIETARKGVIYEHKPQSLTAQKLATELAAIPEELRKEGATIYEGEFVGVLRAIERAARAPAAGDGERSYLALVGRLIGPRSGGRDAGPEGTRTPTSPLVLP